MGKTKHNCRQAGCGIAYGLDISGDKWTLVIVRDITLPGKNFERVIGFSTKNGKQDSRG
jgi:DNA-binding HxlR family transcriptional regulator